MSSLAPRLKSIALILVILSLAACGGEDRAEREGMKVFRFADDGAPTSLDPAQAATVYANMVVTNTYDTLYRYKYLARPYEITPNLAVDFPEVSEDGLTYTFRIHPGVEFVDDPAFPDGVGREVTMHDLVYSLQRHFDPGVRSQGGWMWQSRIVGLDAWGENGADYSQPVEGLEVVDDHTLNIHLVAPYPQLIYTLAMGFSGIVPREAVEHYGREFAIRPVGSGPFRLLRFDSARALLERNPKFDRGALDLAAEGYDVEIHGDYGLEPLDGRVYPFVDRVEMNFIEEPAARWSTFVRGNEAHNVIMPNEQVDSVLASTNPVTFRPEIRERYHAYTSLEAGFVYYGFNMADDRLGYHDDPEQNRRNRELRCAMRDAFDWEARNNTFYFGLGSVFPGVIPPVVPEFDPDLDRDSVTRNLDRARQRLEDHGWDADNMPPITYNMVSSVTLRQMFEQFRSQMQALGYPTRKISPQTYATFGDFNRAVKSRQADFFGMGWGLDYPDAENTLQLFYGPNETPGSNNSNYNNPEFDELFRQTKTMQPGPERTALYQRMNRMVIDDCVVLSGLTRTRIHMWHKNALMVPDREILGGFFIRFVDIADD